MTTDYVDRIKADILKTGYVTEMIVTAILNKAGWTAADHTYYLDKDENKGREIDAVSIRHAVAEDEKKRVTVTLALATEIKRSADKPWVVFTTPSKGEVSPSLFSTVLARLNPEEIWFHELYANHHQRSFPRLGRIAYQTFLGQQNAEKERGSGYGNQTFGGLVSCFKAANEIVGYFENAHRQPLRHPETGQKTYEIGITHGLFVVDGGLFEAVVHERDQVEVREADHIPYVFNYASKEYGNRAMLMDFVTVKHLPSYLEAYGLWLEERAAFCLQALS